MPKHINKSQIVGLDIGTTKIVSIIAEASSDGSLDIIGVGQHPSRGLKRGVVVNIEATTQSIRRAIEESELMSGMEVDSVFAGIAGSHIRSLNSHGIVAIREKEVRQHDVDRVIDAAKAVAIPADQKILHVLPQEFLIDNQQGVREPVGMSGVRLEAKVHMVTGAVSAAQNIVKCVEQCGLHVNDVILEQLASSYAVLTEDERELGVCLIDIGGGTTDIAIFTEGAIRHTAVIPIAGDQVTNDIAVALRTPTKNAEEIKIAHSQAMHKLADPNKMIEVPSVAGRPTRQLSEATLAEVVSARYEELFAIVAGEIRRSGFEDLVPAGIVITGGAALVNGAIELAEQVFNMPVRLGLPQRVRGLTGNLQSPIYATSVGLLVYGLQQMGHPIQEFQTTRRMQGAWSRMTGWFKGNF